MAAYGSDWRTNPVPQIKWGLNYIENRYNTPCGAWSFFQSHNWYWAWIGSLRFVARSLTGGASP